jgi:hypothetical protein
MLAAAAAAAESKQNNAGGISGVAARSRKSRDPKRVRPSADHSPKSDDSDSKQFPATTFDADDVTSREKHFQTEPEDLSSRKRRTADDEFEDEKVPI